jgi:hypothetical protein
VTSLRTRFEDAGTSARCARSTLFARLLASLPKPLRILEVQIELLNLVTEPVRAPFTSVAGDARDLSRYPDRSFDIVFSNSVIGHVGGLSDQARAASEVRRVGRCYFVQTPNHGFPVDWRTMVPLFHFLPRLREPLCNLRQGS